MDKADPLGERRRQASDRGKALAGRCTLNRLELTAAEVDEQERYKKIAMDPNRIDGWMVDAFVESHESAPEEIVLDLDASSMAQEGRDRHYCYLPLYIFSEEHLLCARLRVPISMGPRDRWRNWKGSSAGFGAGRRSPLVIRAALGRDDLLRWCEDHHVDYVMGLANNDRLKSESAEAMTQAEAEFNATGTPARVFKDFRYRTRHSWTSDDASSARPSSWQAPIPVVTSLSPERLGARRLYEEDCANRMDPQASRSPANQLRLYLSSAAYMLMHALRRLGLKQTPLARAQCQDSLKLLKIAVDGSASRSATSAKMSEVSLQEVPASF